MLQEVSHFLGVGLDGVHVVQDRPALGQNLPGRRRLVLKEFLPVPEFPDVVSGVGHIDIVGLPDEVPDAAKVPLHILKFSVYGLQPLVLLGGHSIHLLVHGLHQVADVSLGENVGANLFDDQVLESPSVEPRGVAGSAALLHEGLTDIIWKLAALGVLAGQCTPAGLALDQPAEEEGTCNPAGVDDLGGA